MACRYMEATFFDNHRGLRSSWSASLNGFKRAGPLVINDKYDNSLEGDENQELFHSFYHVFMRSGASGPVLNVFFFKRHRNVSWCFNVLLAATSGSSLGP